MKKIVTMLFLLSIARVASAQEEVSFSQEQDTLIKQNFIDRYQNVFMTKIPTRHMVKLSAIGSEVQGVGINLGYEFKVSPSLSLEASLYYQLSRANSGLVNELIHFNGRNVNIWANAKARWYYNMNKRMRNGLTANNFSGPYVGLSYEQPIKLGYGSYIHNYVGRLGLLYGFQSRFFNHGFFDFSAGIYQRALYQIPDFQESYRYFAWNNLVLGTQFNIGLAVGDWKKSPTAPLCDVIFCDESVKAQVKVQIPNIALSWNNQMALTEIAYERALGKTPLSVQAELGLSLYRREYYYGSEFVSLSAVSSIALRYYFLRNLQNRRGKGGSNLSGAYASAGGSFDLYYGSSKSELNTEKTGWNSNLFRSTIALGYQQRLFSRMYIDVSAYATRSLTPQFYYVTNKTFISSKMSIGFTF